MTDDEARPAVDRVADVVFFGPLGFVLEHRRLLPQMAQRGRRQIAFTAMIGRFTVRHGRERVQGLIEGLAGRAPADEPAPAPLVAVPSLPTTDVTTETETETASTMSAAALAIPQYDSLSAIQVVPRLEGLTDTELTQLRDYEVATRSRRTILAKISQLQQ